MKNNKKPFRFFSKEIKKNFFKRNIETKNEVVNETNKQENTEKEYTDLYLQTTRWQTI